MIDVVKMQIWHSFVWMFGLDTENKYFEECDINATRMFCSSFQSEALN
jgi:hypothetical protein